MGRGGGLELAGASGRSTRRINGLRAIRTMLDNKPRPICSVINNIAQVNASLPGWQSSGRPAHGALDGGGHQVEGRRGGGGAGR